jgi:hypothetical protein
MTLEEIFRMLPKSASTVWKHINRKTYPFELVNDWGLTNEFRVIADGKTLGVIQYFKGKKLSAWAIAERSL